MLKDSDRNMLLFRSRFLKQKEHWIKKLSGEFDVTDILLGDDKKHPAKVDNVKIEIPLPNELGNRIIKLCKGIDLSIYIFLLTALKCLIFRYTSNEDIIVLSPINKHKVKEKEIINSLLFIRNQVDDTLTFKELVLRVRQTVLEAYENQDYPYDKLLEYLFPLPERHNKQIISNILCSLGNLHDDRDIEKINTRFSFKFLKTADRIDGWLSYGADTCEEIEVVRLADHFVLLLLDAVENLKVKISELQFLQEQEKKQLLVDFNNNRRDFPGDKSICHFIEEHAKKRPDAVAVAFMNCKITYLDLDQRSGQLAKRLGDSGVREDQLVGILLERSPQMVECILAVWKSSGAYIPLEPWYPGQRIHEILQDSQAAVLISSSKHLNANGALPYYDRIINLDDRKNDTLREGKKRDLEIDMSGLSYIIYTSGSTGKPKGVMVEHIGMMNHMSAKINDLCLTGSTIVAQNSSHTFDISVWQFFTALILGGRIVIFPDELMFEMDQFISGIIREQVTVLEVVPSHLSAILDFLDMDSRRMDGLDYILVTGEAVTFPLVKKWFDSYQGIKMINAYGPTEASDDITHFVMDKAPDGERIPLGKPIQNLNIYIVDKNMNLCPFGVKGEICVSGIGVGRGYLNNEAQTSSTFIGDPFIDIRRGRLYKTGDLGRWLPDGNIEFFGRKDNQVKIRGFRIELGEIESQLTRHPQIKEAVVIIKEATDKYLCAYLVPVYKEKLDLPALKEYLSERLPDYMIPEHFAELEHMPQTPNGKIDRKALSQLDVVSIMKKEYVAPRTDMEKKLTEIWSELLDKDMESIGIDANFFEMGGHSLKATIMVAQTHRKFNVKLPITEVFKTPTIRGLAVYIQTAAQEKYLPLESVEKREYYALSSAQKRLYVHHKMNKESIAYNIQSLVEVEGINDNDKDRLVKTFEKLIGRHESFRTVFDMIAEEPVQKIHEYVEFAFEYYSINDVIPKTNPGNESTDLSMEVNNLIRNFIRPFDLSRAPLLRFGFIKKENQRHILMVDIHHIISDGVSHEIFIKDFLSLYAGKELPVLKFRYRDFSEWQNRLLGSPKLKQQEDYWLKEFQGELPVSNLPTDYPKTEIPGHTGARINFDMDINEINTLKKIAAEGGVTLYMVLLALINILFSKITGQEDIIMGTPVAGRRHADLTQIIGMFVNTLALRNRPTGEKTFTEFLEKVREKTLKAFENQDYQFEYLVSKVAVNRDKNRNPIFDVMFSFMSSDDDPVEIPGLKIKAYKYENIPLKFDINLRGKQIGEDIFFAFEYSERLFKKETLERYLKYFREILWAVGENKNIKLKDINISHNLQDSFTNLPQMAFGF